MAIRTLRKSYGQTRAVEFGPLALKAVQAQMVQLGHSRRYVNGSIDWIRRMFRWAASEELIPASVPHALGTVPGLRKGRTAARETEPILPVDEVTVDATLPHVSPVVAAMIRFQRLTGCRPGEACLLRPCDIDRSGDVWCYRPESHKTEHHDRDRVIFIGPKAQELLRPYLLRPTDAYCFAPAEAEAMRREKMHARRETPLSCGNRPGTNRLRRPRKKAGSHYTNDSYRRAIHRACDLAFPPPAERELSDAELKLWRSKHRWSPNQLRHSAATEIRKQFGLEAVQVTLGHASADVSQIYAERDLSLAANVMRRVG
jgi:integrase